jgi:hypothetical protein
MLGHLQNDVITLTPILINPMLYYTERKTYNMSEGRMLTGKFLTYHDISFGGYNVYASSNKINDASYNYFGLLFLFTALQI